MEKEWAEPVVTLGSQGASGGPFCTCYGFLGLVRGIRFAQPCRQTVLCK